MIDDAWPNRRQTCAKRGQLRIEKAQICVEGAAKSALSGGVAAGFQCVAVAAGSAAFRLGTDAFSGSTYPPPIAGEVAWLVSARTEGGGSPSPVRLTVAVPAFGTCPAGGEGEKTA